LIFASLRLIFTSEDKQEALMAVAAPNQTRLKILSSVLQLKEFTVAELCLHAGLDRSQVYRDLAELQKEKVLSSDAVQHDGKNAPRYRPTKLYKLASDPKILEELESDLGLFFPQSDPNSNRHLKRAISALESISREFLATVFASLEGNEFDSWQTRIENSFLDIQRWLEQASWESDVDFSEGDHSSHPIVQAADAFRTLKARVLQQVGEEQSRRKQYEVRRRWTDIISSFLPTAFPVASIAMTTTPQLARGLVDEVVKRSGASTYFMDELKRIATDLDLTSGILIGDLEPYINSLQLDLREVRSGDELLAAVSKYWITYGNQVEPAWLWTEALAASSRDYRLIFNKANLAQLAQQSAKAYDSWAKYLSIRKPRTNTPEQTLLARVQGRDWSREGYEEAVRVIAKECEASVSAFSETSFDREEEFTVEPKLYNPLYNESEHESLLISIAEPLAKDARFHVLTSEATKPVIVGLPVVARAGIYHSRMPKRVAWKLATEASEDERIVKVDFFRGADPEIRLRAENVLKTNLCAHVVG
jgi:hypothetical protein